MDEKRVDRTPGEDRYRTLSEAYGITDREMPETAARRVMISLAERSDSVVLLGAQPDYPEVEYGWKLR